MSTSSRFVLVLAVSLSACTDRYPVGPQSTSGFTETLRRAAPTDLHAFFIGGNGGLVLSWSYRSQGINAAGFLVERAPAPDGPWSIVRFTEATRTEDAISDGLRRCYHVIAVLGSDAGNSDPSNPLCVQPAKL